MLKSPSLAVVSGWPPLFSYLLEAKHFISSKTANVSGGGTFLQRSCACREVRGDIPSGGGTLGFSPWIRKLHGLQED